jgi:predicted HicB family RNase H-like nuclease
MSKIVSTQLRLDETLFAKSKILAAVYDESFNAFAARTIQEAVKIYEAKHGELPKPLRQEG